MKRFAFLALASGMAIAAASPANAAIFASVIIDGTQANLFPNVALDAGTGLYSFTYLGGGGNVSVQLSATGKGSSNFAAPDPQFLTQALTIDATGSHSIQVLLSQTGLTSTTPGFAVTHSINTLLGTGSATAAAYIGGNTAYTQGTMIGNMLSCSASTCDSGTMVSAIAHSTPFSETVAYNFNITNGRIQANTQISAAVPEPATWGMMIVGFGLMGGALRRRKTTVAFA